MVEVELKSQSQKPVVFIPQKAIRKILNQNFVFVVNKENKIEEKKIQLGESIKDMQIVLMGLEAGELLVIEDIQKVGSGQIVEPVKI